MSYFNDVYLKRMNKDGKTRQERIRTREIKEFNNIFLPRTMYQSLLYQINEKESNYVCAVEPNKWNESNLIGNLLMPTSAEALQTGDILHIFQKIDDVEVDRIWLVFFVEKNITKGHQLYKIICLDDEINLTNEYGDSQQIIPVKFVSATSTFVQDIFHVTSRGYREPQNNRSFITADFDFLPKGTYFRYADRGWEIGGKDNISIKNVAYVHIQERLYAEEEPRSSEDILVGEDDNFLLLNS